jgi:hypothetical protein
MRMDADAFGGAMIDGDEHRSRVFGDGCGQVSAPHCIDGFRNDGAVMAECGAWIRQSRRSEIV